MGIASALSENNTRANIDHRYNNDGRAYRRDQAVQGFGSQQFERVNNQFNQTNTTGNQGIARRGLSGGSADLKRQSRLARGLQDARAGVSGQMLGMAQQLQGQDEQARQGLSSQFNGALSANTQAQQGLTNLAGRLSNNATDINQGMLNGVVNAGVGAYNQGRINGQKQDAINNHQSIIPRGDAGMTMLPQHQLPQQYAFLNGGI